MNTGMFICIHISYWAIAPQGDPNVFYRSSACARDRCVRSASRALDHCCFKIGDDMDALWYIGIGLILSAVVGAVLSAAYVATHKS
jgi:hypothetical protein